MSLLNHKSKNNENQFLCKFYINGHCKRGNNSLLEKEKHNSEYFAIKPSFKIYTLPKKVRQKIVNINKQYS